MVRILSSLTLCSLSASPVSHLRRGGFLISLCMTGVVINILVLTLLHHYAVPFPVYSPCVFMSMLSVWRPQYALLTAAARMV